MDSVNVLSYNLKSHAAYPELADLAAAHDAKILCLQECYVDELTDDIGELKLSAKTTTGKFGLAIYSDDSRFSIIKSSSIPILPSIYERLHVQARERLLIVELFDHTSQQPFFVASFHATHFVATNYLRRKQLSSALATLNTLSVENPVVLAGDFNYPYFHNKLKKTAQSFAYSLATTDQATFYGRKFRGRFDMAATANIQAHDIQALPFGLSDHAPILLSLSAI